MVAAGRQPASAPNAAAANMTPPKTSTPARSPSAGERFDHRGGAVRDDLAHRLTDLGRIEAHHQDRVGAHHGGVLHQPVDRLAAGLFEQMGVFVDLAADQGAQPRHDVAAEPAAADDNAKTLTLDLDHPVTGDILGRNHQHPSLHRSNAAHEVTRDCLNSANKGKTWSLSRYPRWAQPRLAALLPRQLQL